MATKYLSEDDLDVLATRIAQVFAEKPIVAQFTLETTDWESDVTTDKYKVSVGIDKNFSANSMGDVSIDLGSLNTVSDRLAVEDAVSNAQVRVLDITSEVVNNETIGVIVFYADSIPTLDIPILLTIIGEMPAQS